MMLMGLQTMSNILVGLEATVVSELMEEARKRCPCAPESHDLSAAARVDQVRPGSVWTADDLNAWYDATHEAVRVTDETLVGGQPVVAYRQGGFAVWVEPPSHITRYIVLDSGAQQWGPEQESLTGVEFADALVEQVASALRQTDYAAGCELSVVDTPYALLIGAMAHGHIDGSLSTQAVASSWIHGGAMFEAPEHLKGTAPAPLLELHGQVAALFEESDTAVQYLAVFLDEIASGQDSRPVPADMLAEPQLHAATLAEFGRWVYDGGRPPRGLPQAPLLNRLDRTAARQLQRRAVRMVEAFR